MEVVQPSVIPEYIYLPVWQLHLIKQGLCNIVIIDFLKPIRV